jgi:hypothetical protein
LIKNKATETRAHDRAKQVLDKLFSLFGDEIKKKYSYNFTFIDDFNDFTALRTLIDEKSPFINILGNINELTYFEFINKAYFSNDKEAFSKIFENYAKNYGKLLKYVFILKQISLESSKQVIKNRFDISNYILNVCRELSDIIITQNVSIQKRDECDKIKKNLEALKGCKYKKITVKKPNQVPYEETYKENLIKDGMI